jgi:hypothetical protein
MQNALIKQHEMRGEMRQFFPSIPEENYLYEIGRKKPVKPIRHFQYFLSGEGPRSRRYGRTATLRLIVQHFDEYDDYFLSLS